MLDFQAQVVTIPSENPSHQRGPLGKIPTFSVPFLETITSRQNPRIKNLVKLRERSHRRRQDRILIEGLREIGMALRNGFVLEELYCGERFRGRAEVDTLLTQAEAAGVEILLLSESALEKVSGREHPDGLLAVGPGPEKVVEQLDLSHHPLLVVVDGVEKPGNIGAIIRSAEAAGADAVIIASDTADPYSPQVIRNSRGLVFALPVLVENADYLAGWLRRLELPIVAADPEAGVVPWQVDLATGAALVLGAEHEGLSAFWRKVADRLIRIPLAGQADSLNVSVTAAVLLFEIVRQRQNRLPQ